MSDEFPDGINRTDEEVREMGVQALHTNARPTDAAARLSPVGTHRRAPAKVGVLIMRLCQHFRVNEVFEAVHSPIAFETTDRVMEFGIDQPEKRRHRRAVAKVRFVLDHDWSTVETSHDDGAPSGKGTAEVPLYDGEVVGRRVTKTQRQNSRVRTRRERNAFADEWCLDVEDVGVTNDETDEGETRGWSPGSPML